MLRGRIRASSGMPCSRFVISLGKTCRRELRPTKRNEVLCVYTPAHFAETDLATLHDAIETYSFATLVSHCAGQLAASHLPLLLKREEGKPGTLLGHMA